mmetsp:Transcript_23246/g.69581  ORF Transcript_23246/g.69581 Transcript_23246/m.69581 type:complete len:222 (+) Transcript_23246:564-1229(+)
MRDSPKSSTFGCAPSPRRSTMTLLLFRSPWMMGGVRACMYSRACETPSITWHLARRSGPPASPPPPPPPRPMKRLRVVPPTSSSTSAIRRRCGTMTAPYTATMCGCLKCLKTRSSFARSRSPASAPPQAPRGVFTATNVPHSRPFVTSPKPPEPRRSSGRTRSSSGSTAQCSALPKPAMSSSCSTASCVSRSASKIRPVCVVVGAELSDAGPLRCGPAALA